jgi:hypothetical protein
VADTCTGFTSAFALTVSNFQESPTYAITPAVPAGLEFDTATAAIQGSATEASPKTTYTITATAGSQTASETETLTVRDAGNLPCATPSPAPEQKPEPTVEWVPEVTEFEVTEFPFIVTPPPPPPSPSGEDYTFTKDDTSTSDCTVDAQTSTLTVPKPGTCVVEATTPETDDFAEYTITQTFTFTGATLAATGTRAFSLWLGMAAIIAGAAILSRRYLIGSRE